MIGPPQSTTSRARPCSPVSSGHVRSFVRRAWSKAAPSRSAHCILGSVCGIQARPHGGAKEHFLDLSRGKGLPPHAREMGVPVGWVRPCWPLSTPPHSGGGRRQSLLSCTSNWNPRGTRDSETRMNVVCHTWMAFPNLGGVCPPNLTSKLWSGGVQHSSNSVLLIQTANWPSPTQRQ